MATSPYKYLTLRDHALSTPSGYVPEHRIVLYDKIGPGPHSCHWCGSAVNWMPGHRTRDGALIADHIDGVQRNNDPANLVPSCHPCNQRRPFDALMAGRVYVMEGGRRNSAVQRVCQNAECGRPFLIAVKHLRRPGRRAGRYCCRSCMYVGRSQHSTPARLTRRSARGLPTATTG